MPTDDALQRAGRHDMRWALRIHNRARIAEVAGLADPNASHPVTRASKKLRLDYPDARRFMCAQNPRLLSQRRFREWSQAGNRPWFIPADPKKYYADRDVWVSWEDFLGVRVGAGDLERVRPFKAYVEARKYMRALRRSGVGGRVTIVRRRRKTQQGRPKRKTTTKIGGTPGEMGMIMGGAPAIGDGCSRANTSSGYKVWASSGHGPRTFRAIPSRCMEEEGNAVSWDDFWAGKRGSEAKGQRTARKKWRRRQRRRRRERQEEERASEEQE